MLEKAVSLLVIDTELAGSSLAGTVTESLVHPKSKKAFIGHFIRAAAVGWLLATFLSPAIAHRFNLSKPESCAIAFIGGYAGIKLLDATEKALLKRISSTKDEKKDA